MKKNIKKASRGIFLSLVIMLTLFLTACSDSDMITWILEEFGITVKVEMVDLTDRTKAGKWISGDLNSTQANQLNDNMESDYDIIISANPTTKYNCHSYAWYYRSTSNIWWINDPVEFRTNWIVSSNPASNTIPSSAQNGDIVDYYVSSNISPHSAIVYDKTATRSFISKWGAAGLYLHKPTDTPYNDESKENTTEQFGYYRTATYK